MCISIQLNIIGALKYRYIIHLSINSTVQITGINYLIKVKSHNSLIL